MYLSLLIYLQGSTNSDPTGVLCCGSIVLIIAIAIAVGISTNNQRARALANARDNYQNSLIRLKKDPTNADLRQTTLALGRTYSNLTINNKGVTIFDEVALANDINAACAGATAPTRDKVASHHQAQTLEQRLEKLAELKTKGLITEEEYSQRRTKKLDDV